MAMIEGFRIQNYRALKDIAMGRIGTDPILKKAAPLTPMTTFIGKNGVGKSSIFDALELKEVWVLEKGEDGFSHVTRANEIEFVQNMVNEGQAELIALLRYCDKKPKSLFRIAIEELEAWFFGDPPALKKAYPKIRQSPSFKCFRDGLRKLAAVQPY
jgi:AAA ATPase domain